MDITNSLRPSIASDELRRPDWTISSDRGRQCYRLDKNENIDPKLNAIISDVICSLDGQVVYGYPDISSTYLKLAKWLDVYPENLLFSHGSDGVIRSTFDAFVGSDDSVLLTSPTFMMYEVYAKMCGANLIKVNYDSSNNGPVLEVDRLIDGILQHQPKLVCIPNPDSPTGTVFQKMDLESIISTCEECGSIILVDEAYYPFCEVSAISLINNYPNLIIARTFAKAWGMAGLRVGYAVGGQEIIYNLHKVRPMYEVSSIAIAVVDRMLDKFDQVSESVLRLQDGMDYFLNELKKDGFKVFKGAGNFSHVMFGSREDLIHSRLKNKVLYKPSFSHASLKGYSRFSSAPIEIMEKVILLIRE